MKKALSVAMLAIWFVLMSWVGGCLFDQFADDPCVSHFMLAFSIFSVVAVCGWIPLFRNVMRELGI